MIVLDANILLYAYDERAAHHRAAKAYLQNIFSKPDPIAIPLRSVAAFVRITTHPGRVGLFSLEEVIEIVDEWLALPQVRLLVAGEHSWKLLRRTLIDGHATGRLVTDAEIAMLTMEYGGELQTADRGFARFPGLRWKNPLVKH